MTGRGLNGPNNGLPVPWSFTILVSTRLWRSGLLWMADDSSNLRIWNSFVEENASLSRCNIGFTWRVVNEACYNPRSQVVKHCHLALTTNVLERRDRQLGIGVILEWIGRCEVRWYYLHSVFSHHNGLRPSVRFRTQAEILTSHFSYEVPWPLTLELLNRGL